MSGSHSCLPLMLAIPWVYPVTIPTAHPYTRFEMASLLAPHHYTTIGMPYRILCNGVQQEGAKLSPALASELFCYVPLHKIRYGVTIGMASCLYGWTNANLFSNFSIAAGLLRTRFVIPALVTGVVVLDEALKSGVDSSSFSSSN